MSDVVVAWKKGVWGRNRIYPEIESKVFLGLIRFFDTDKNEQIFVHREGEKIYYAYLWKLSKFDYISLGLLTNKLCLDYYDLLRTFRTFVKDMAVNKLCVYNSKRGKIKLSSNNIQKQPRQRTLLDINIKSLKAQLDEKQKKWSKLPSQKLGILKSDVVPCTLEIQGSSWIVSQLTSGYRNVCISIRDEIKPQNEERRSKESSIASIVNSLQFLPKSSSTAKSAKMLKSLGETNGTKGKKGEKNHLDWDEIFAASVVVGGILSVLLDWIAPWFISTIPIWLKIFIVLISSLGVYLVIYTTDDNHKGKNVTLAGWGGAIAILLSTILTICGLCGGFSPDLVDEDEKTQIITGNTIVQETEREKVISKPTLISRIPNNFVLVSSGILRRYFDHYDDNYNNVYRDWAVDSFYICKFEVIQKDFETIMGKNPSKYKEDSIPVHGITIFDAVLYCNKKSGAEGFDGFYEIDSSDRVKLKTNGNGYRLPTDHEWALAVRSGERKTTKYAAGNNLKEIAWYGGNSGNKPHKVGTKQPNGRGLYDMNGNVLELCLFDDGKVWGKGSSYNLYISFEEETGIGYGGTLSSKKSQGEDMGMRLVFIPKR